MIRKKFQKGTWGREEIIEAASNPFDNILQKVTHYDIPPAGPAPGLSATVLATIFCRILSSVIENIIKYSIIGCRKLLDVQQILRGRFPTGQMIIIQGSIIAQYQVEQIITAVDNIAESKKNGDKYVSGL